MSPVSPRTMVQPLRIARSPVGHTSRRCIVNIKNMSAEQRPIPQSLVNSAPTAESSGWVRACSRFSAPVWMAWTGAGVLGWPIATTRLTLRQSILPRSKSRQLVDTGDGQERQARDLVPSPGSPCNWVKSP